MPDYPLKPREPKPRFKLADVTAALAASGGIINQAARILHSRYGSCSRATVRTYIARYPKLREVMDEATETTLDVAETKLKDAIEAGDINAVKFILETKGKQRGYTRRLEHSGMDGRPIEVSDARAQFIAELAEMAARLGSVPGGASGAAGAARPNGSDAPAEEAE